MSLVYAGTIITDLNAAVGKVFRRHNFEVRQSTVDLGDPEAILKAAQIHLTDLRNSPRWQVQSRWPEMDHNDVSAFNELQDILDCLDSGLTDICKGCRRMEGSHAFFTNTCPDGQGTFQLRGTGVDQ